MCNEQIAHTIGLFPILFIEKWRVRQKGNPSPKSCKMWGVTLVFRSKEGDATEKLLHRIHWMISYLNVQAMSIYIVEYKWKRVKNVWVAED